jgi:hypothetical protein
MENGMLIGRNAEKRLPDMSPDAYHGKRDAYVASQVIALKGLLSYTLLN